MKPTLALRSFLPIGAALGLALIPSSANAEISLLENFEAATTTGDYANTMYDKGGVLGASDDGSLDLNGIANVPPDAGNNLTKTAFQRSSNRVITLRTPLALDSGGYTSFTVKLDYFYNYSTTGGIQLEYSALGNFTDTKNVFKWVSNTVPINHWQYGASVVINENATFVFTDTAKIRFRSGGTANSQHGYLDNISITAGAIPGYTVTYDGNGSTGGSVPVDSNTYATAATVTVLGNTGSLVKTGLVFTGWNTQADGFGTHFNPAATFSMGSANVTLYADWKTSYDNWAAGFTPNPGGTGANPDGDALNNLQEFAFAFNPNVSDGSGPLTISGASITQNGPPQIYVDPGTGQYFLRYTRRTDYVAAGLTYTAQFAADSLGAGSFENVTGGSVVGTGTGAGGVAIEAVAIEFPDALPVSGKKARFGRVQVTTP